MSEFFASLTTWQAEYWNISVTIDGFTDVQEAAKFGYFARSLVREEENLFLIDGDGERIQLSDSQVRVYERKPEFYHKTMISDEDFVEKDIPMYLFSEIEGLNGTFGSLSYGVRDKDLKPVKFDSKSFSKPDPPFPSSACPPYDELVFIAPDHHLFAQYWRDRNNFTEDNFRFWTDGETIAVRKDNGEQIEQILNLFKGAIVTKSERDM
jgi:hypothetical protein